MRLDAFYHIWGDGHWRQPLAEFRSALDRSNFAGRVHYIVVGSPDPNEWREYGVHTAGSCTEGNEYVTLNALRRHAQSHPGATLYAHTKGAYENTDFRARWRRSMTHRVINGWPGNLTHLESGAADAVGCHWLTEAEYPGMFGPMTVPMEGSGFFAGNFWMATNNYLRRLPPCTAEPRWQAEAWIGLGRPRVVDLLPGWPHDNRWPELCE